MSVMVFEAFNWHPNHGEMSSAEDCICNGESHERTDRCVVFWSRAIAYVSVRPREIWHARAQAIWNRRGEKLWRPLLCVYTMYCALYTWGLLVIRHSGHNPDECAKLRGRNAFAIYDSYMMRHVKRDKWIFKKKY